MNNAENTGIQKFSVSKHLEAHNYIKTIIQITIHYINVSALVIGVILEISTFSPVCLMNWCMHLWSWYNSGCKLLPRKSTITLKEYK